MNDFQFRIQHYAGRVKYEIDGFVEKNRDQLYPTIASAAFTSDSSLLRDCFPEGNKSFCTLASDQSDSGSPDFDIRKRPSTQGHQFKQSMQNLMKLLLSKNPNYIRCIKPNESKSPAKFDTELVRHQVRYLGLLENVRVRRAGYAFRQSYNEFKQRYKMLSAETWPNSKFSAKEATCHILKECKIDESEFQKGISKIFIRNPRIIFKLEELRSVRLVEIVAKIQL